MTKKSFFKASLKNITLGVAAVAILGTAACGTQSKKDLEKKDKQYWQRVDASSAIHLRGPKALQRLNKNISECVVEIKELKKLGAIQKAIPGKDKDSDALSHLSEYETPDRDGFQRREYFEYHDFESCMHAKGWERVKHVPYDVADRSIRTFEKVHASYHPPKKKTPTARGDFDNFND